MSGRGDVAAGAPPLVTYYGLGRTCNVVQAQVNDPVAKSEKHGVRQSISEERFASRPLGVALGDKATSAAMTSRPSDHVRLGGLLTMDDSRWRHIYPRRDMGGR
jgi:hypothetical protein